MQVELKIGQKKESCHNHCKDCCDLVHSGLFLQSISELLKESLKINVYSICYAGSSTDLNQHSEDEESFPGR